MWFDFHAECKNMKYENISKLLDIVNASIENYDYFYIEIPKSEKEYDRPVKKNLQKGIFRSNCMDCLDRTNVVQSSLARQILIKWLIRLNVITKGRNVAAF